MPGPQLELSPTSDPSDGHLELVLAQESERTRLLELATGGAIIGAPSHATGEARRRARPARGLPSDGELIELSEQSVPGWVTMAPASVRFIV
jgi:hypothetical protein